MRVRLDCMDTAKTPRLSPDQAFEARTPDPRRRSLLRFAIARLCTSRYAVKMGVVAPFAPPDRSVIMSQPDIESAIDRVKTGAVDQYRTVIAAFHQPLRAALAGLCPPGIDADEIAHVTFIEAYRHLERYRSGSNFFAWLCAIARNQLLAETKRLLRQSRNQQNYLEHALTQRLLAVAEAHEELSEMRFRFLNECVALLSPASQSLLEARYQQRRPLDDIAQMLSKTVSAVSVQLFSIRQKLRECVEKKWRSHVAGNP